MVFPKSLQKWPIEKYIKIHSAFVVGLGHIIVMSQHGGLLSDPSLQYLFRGQIRSLQPFVGSGHFHVFVENSMAALRFHLAWHYDAIQAG